MRLIPAWLFGALLLSPIAAGAGTIQITGSGTWDSSVPTTPLSAPSETWSFSLVVLDPINADGTATVVSSQYFLNGTAVSDAVTGITFSPDYQYGMFSVMYTSGDYINLYGAQVYDNTSLALLPGTYSANIDINDNAYPPAGSGAGTVVIATVPEPSSLISGAMGLLAIVGLSWRRRQRIA